MQQCLFPIGIHKILLLVNLHIPLKLSNINALGNLFCLLEATVLIVGS